MPTATWWAGNMDVHSPPNSVTWGRCAPARHAPTKRVRREEQQIQKAHSTQALVAFPFSTVFPSFPKGMRSWNVRVTLLALVCGGTLRRPKPRGRNAGDREWELGGPTAARAGGTPARGRGPVWAGGHCPRPPPACSLHALTEAADAWPCPLGSGLSCLQTPPSPPE